MQELFPHSCTGNIALALLLEDQHIKADPASGQARRGRLAKENCLILFEQRPGRTAVTAW